MPRVDTEDTIAAIATAPGGAMRSIIRVSGPRVVSCLQRCFSSDVGWTLGQCRHPKVITGLLELIDSSAKLPCDVYFWPTNRSYTRQPMGELHTIGSPPLVEAALRTLCAAGARLAEAGEFTLRAFLAGRMDLPQAEAVLGVIDARGERELRVALSQLAGGLSQPLNVLRDRLLDLLAELEAGLDFSEEDIEFISAEQLDQQLQETARTIDRLVEQMSSRADLAGAPRIVLLGYPNVGKSSLLNALAAQPVSLVADLPGTTRDYVTRRVQLDGVACEMTDTAGVDPLAAEDPLSSAAQNMTKQQRANAHLEIFCIDATRKLNTWERTQLATPGDQDRLLVLTKTDCPRGTDLKHLAIKTSSRTGLGVAELRREIARKLAGGSTEESHVVAQTLARCGDSLRLSQQSLRRARNVSAAQGGEELIAAEVRTALEELGKVAGAVYTEDILDRIFSRFCIGK